ncbi:hypothetical protein P9214_09860 [Heyndrickxia coagulans]|nr:hypothetical protein [Heyndrickxia coagulans]
MNIRKILIAGLMFILMIIIGTAGYVYRKNFHAYSYPNRDRAGYIHTGTICCRFN